MITTTITWILLGITFICLIIILIKVITMPTYTWCGQRTDFFGNIKKDKEKRKAK